MVQPLRHSSHSDCLENDTTLLSVLLTWKILSAAVKPISALFINAAVPAQRLRLVVLDTQPPQSGAVNCVVGPAVSGEWSK